MKLIIEKTFDPQGDLVSVQFVDTARHPNNTVVNPAQSDKPVSALEFLAWLNSHPEKLAENGYLDQSQHPDETQPKTRWQRLVESANAPDADDDVRALNLHL